MAKGFRAVAAAAADINERKNSGGNFVKRRYFKLDPDEKAQVRFLEAGDDVQGGWFHVHPHPKFQYGILIPCIDQDSETGERVGKDCPGCEENMKRKFQGVINLIQRDAPKYKKDSEGNDTDEVIGTEDTVVVWQSGIESFEELQIQDETYGLDSRDFIIRRRGSGKNTKYSINPVDGGAKALSKADKELASDKYDLNEITEPASYENWGIRKPKSDEDEGPREVRESPFAQARR